MSPPAFCLTDFPVLVLVKKVARWVKATERRKIVRISELTATSKMRIYLRIDGANPGAEIRR